MKRKEVIRKYKMSDAALIQKADGIKNLVNRDLADLAAYGVTPANVDDLEDARDAFDNTSTDDELMADMIIATQAKNALRTSVLSKIRQVADRARIKFGEEDGKFRKFGVQLLTKNNDNDLVRVGKRVARTGTLYLAELASEGLTAPIIADLEAEVSAFDNAIDEQETAITERDIAVQDRILLGNALYAIIVNLAAKGKLCYLETNEAKYNDYVLNNIPEGGTTLDGTVSAGSVVNISATGVNNATVFTINNTGAADLKFYFAQTPTDPSGPQFIILTGGSNQVVSAVELGYNEALNYDRLNVNNETPLDGSYQIEY